jgi:Sec-independent protein translocase protein TatA
MATQDSRPGRQPLRTCRILAASRIESDLLEETVFMDLLAPAHLFVPLLVFLIIFVPSQFGGIGGALGNDIRGFKHAFNAGKNPLHTGKDGGWSQRRSRRQARVIMRVSVAPLNA